MSVRRKITFDRAEIRKTIIPYSFNEARRVRGPIYEALIQELHEAGCSKTARHFRCLVYKEREFIKLQTIQDKLSDDRELLLTLFENMKKAEQLSKLHICGGKAASYRLLLKSLLLLERHIGKFEWLLRDIYEIIAAYCDAMLGRERSAAEAIARIYFKYADFLNERNEQLQKAVELLEKARYLARGQKWEWYTETSMDATVESLHCAVSKLLAEVLINWGKDIVAKKPEFAVELGTRAILAIAEVGALTNRYEYFAANILKAELLIECPHYDEALLLLNQFENPLGRETGLKFLVLYCTLLQAQGVCHAHFKEMDKAEEKLIDALYLSQKIGLKAMEAKTFLYLGKLWSEIATMHGKAREAFAKAKEMFIELNDKDGPKQLIYLLAKLKFNEIQPQFKELLKNPNEMYKVRRWVYRCQPFWDANIEED